MNIELPKDADGREIPRNTEVMYDINGKKVHITSFTYRCDVHGLWSQWKVFSHDITGEKDGMLPADSLYLTSPDSWEKLEEDLSRASGYDVILPSCRYFTAGKCVDCRMRNGTTCGIRKNERAFADILERIHKLRGED